MNWEERFELARYQGAFTWRDVDLAQSWRSCAVGELLPERAAFFLRVNIWRYVWLRVTDKTMRLGHEFGNAVWKGDVVKAERVYLKIKDIARNTSIGAPMPERTRRVEPDVVVVPPIPVEVPTKEPVRVEPEREKVPA